MPIVNIIEQNLSDIIKIWASQTYVFLGNSSTPREFPTGIGANRKPVDCEICSKTWQIPAAITVEEKFTMEEKEKNIWD